MKKNKIILISAIGLALVALVGFFFMQGGTPNGDAYVSSSTGALYAQRAEQKVDLDVGDVVQQHDKVTTAETTTADITFSDGSKLRLAPNTTVNIEEYAFGESNYFTIELMTGALRTVTGEIVKKNPLAFQVKTPKSLLGIRGTEFFTSVYDTIETYATFYIDEAHTLLVENNENEIALNEPLQVTSLEEKALTPVATVTLEEMENKVDSIAPTLSGSIPTSANEQGQWNSLEDYDETIVINYHNLTTAEVLSDNNPYIVNITGDSLDNAAVTTSSKDDFINIGTTGYAQTKALEISTLDGNDKVTLFGKILGVNPAEAMNGEARHIAFELGAGDDLLRLENINEDGFDKIFDGFETDERYPSTIHASLGIGNDSVNITNTKTSQLYIDHQENLISNIHNSYLETLAFTYDEEDIAESGSITKIAENSFLYKTDSFSNTFTFSGNTEIDMLSMYLASGVNDIINFTPTPNIGKKFIYFTFAVQEKPTFAYFENDSLNATPYQILTTSAQSAVVLGKNVQAQYSAIMLPIFLAGGTVLNPESCVVINTHSNSFRINSTADYEALGVNSEPYSLKLSKSFWSEPIITSDNNPYVPQFTITFTANNGFTLQMPTMHLSPTLPKTAEEVRALIKDDGDSYVLEYYMADMMRQALQAQ